LNWNKLHLFGIDLIYTDLRNYQNLIEGFLSKEKRELEKDYDEADLEKEAEKAGAEKEQYFQHLIDSFAERHHEISRQFPHNFRASFLVQVISVIESELKKICNHYGNHKNQKFVVDDLKGSNDLEKCKNYLTSITEIEFKEYSGEWSFINQCKLLRNKIVHHDSVIKRTDKNLITFADNNDSIELLNFEELHYENIEFLIVNSKLIDELLISSEKFFRKLLDSGVKYNR
jgi:pterin-4a-carbinolamine dehydratase